MPVLPNGLKMMADQGFQFARPLLIPPSKRVQLPDRIRKWVLLWSENEHNLNILPLQLFRLLYVQQAEKYICIDSTILSVHSWY